MSTTRNERPPMPSNWTWIAVAVWASVAVGFVSLAVHAWCGYASDRNKAIVACIQHIGDTLECRRAVR